MPTTDGGTAVSTTGNLNATGSSSDVAKVVAWWNPSTRRWETPAPWDPVYRSRRHTATTMPSGQVHVRRRPAVSDVQALAAVQGGAVARAIEA